MAGSAAILRLEIASSFLLANTNDGSGFKTLIPAKPDNGLNAGLQAK